MARFGAAQGPQPTEGIRSILDRYASADYVGALRAAPLGETAVHVWARFIMRDAPGWIDTAGPGSAVRRRLVVGTYVLDIARAVLGRGSQDERLYATEEERLREGREIEMVLEWSCNMLRSSSNPPAAEKTWFVASVDLVRYLGLDREFLYGPSAAPPGMGARFRSGHLAHALAMFPDDPRLKLAAAEEPPDAWLGGFAAVWLTDEERRLISRRREVAPATLNATLQAGVALERRVARGERINPADQEVIVDASGLAVLQPAAEALQPFLAYPSIRPLVDLHLGCISFCLGQHEQALRYFADIQPNAPACPQYLGHLFSGRIQDLEHRTSEAERSYRAAAAILPHAQSAAQALAEILWREGRHREATDVIIAATQDHSDEDPWLAGGAEWCSDVPRLIDILRSELQ